VAIAGSISEIPDEFSASNGIALGADGGSGGKGGEVRIEFGGTLETSGNSAAGIIAQSIGGGGGSVGTTTTGTLEKIVLSFGILSADSGAVRGSGPVMIDTAQSKWANAGLVSTTGDLSAGLIAQAVNAGGGLISMTGDAQPDANRTFSPMELSFGHQGFTSSGLEASAEIRASGAINTKGKVSAGAVVQAIGAGGGIIHADSINPLSADHKVVVTGTGSTTPTTTTASATFSDSSDKKVTLQTHGDGSVGVIAQALSGYGGAIFADQTMTLDMIDATGATSIALKDSTSVANMTLNGSILTYGKNAHGAFLQAGGSALTTFGTNGVTTQQLYGGGATNSTGEVNFTLANGAHIKAFGSGSDGVRIEGTGAGDFTANVQLDSTIAAFAPDTWAMSIHSDSIGYAANVNMGLGGGLFNYAESGSGGGLKITGDIADVNGAPSVMVNGYIHT
jgi:hypothetical protein